MKEVFERLLGPLGRFQRLRPGPGPQRQGARWGYVPIDQRRALRMFWVFFLGVLAVIVLSTLTISVVRGIA
jgi:hypothetical protein